uniref:GRIP domain-containing protein n=1 Tax=Macrostomum lignano TaxID=282301 RepID=A0A1I8G4J5_9PLAT
SIARMAQQPGGPELQRQCQPHSIVSEEDFVVIAGSGGSSPSSLQSPGTEATDYQLSLTAATASSSSESELQKMAQQISQVSQQQASLHDSLRDNSGSLEQLRNLMRERQAEMKKKLADKDAELGEKTEQCEALLASSEQMKAELARLGTREEEWQQTSEDYQKLKNQYNLLTNTKERLESEKADLQRSRDETLAAETQKLQAKFDEERSAAVEAERDKWQQELAELQANHAAEVKALHLELTGAKKENEGNLQAAQAENERALTSERERCRAEADRLVAEHASAIEAMRKEFEEKIREQERLTEEARRELQELSEKHEAEKAEMFELVKQFGVSSFSTDNFRSNDAGTMTDSSASGGNYPELHEVRTVLSRQAVQEQVRAPLSQSRALRVWVSLWPPLRFRSRDLMRSTSTSETADGQEESSSSNVEGSGAVDQSQTTEIEVKTVESQTDPLECPQIENSESLQKNSATRNLTMQLASFAASLKTERQKVEDLETSIKKLEKENATLKQTTSQTLSKKQNEESVSVLQKQLDEKQSELDSVIKDLDETRNKVCELTEKVKHYESQKMKRAVHGETVGENSDAQKAEAIRELRKQLEEKQMELDSLLQDFDETRHTVYQLNEKVNEYKSQAEQRAQLASSRASADRGTAAATGRLEKLLAEKQVELDSVLEDFDETRHKVYELNEKIKDYERRGDRRDNVANVRADGDTEVKNGGAEANSMQQADEAAKLQKQLEQKQSELDSVLQDFDETRHKVYELNEKIKTLESGSAQGNSQTEKLQQEIRELKSQAEIDKNMANQLHMEIDSARNEQSFKAKKLQAAETEVEKLTEELRKMKELEDELRKQCRESDETVRQVFAKSDESEKELGRLRQDCEAQQEALEQHRNLIEQKADLESQLRETIDELNQRNESHAEESEQKLIIEKRKSEQLYKKLCEQSEMRLNTEQQLKTANEQVKQENQKQIQLQRQQEATQQELRQGNAQLDQLRQQLEQANSNLQDSEKFAADLQSYSDGVDRELENVRQQFTECSKKRDDVIKVAEQMRQRLEEELGKSATAHTELEQLKLEHAKLRNDYSGMERTMTEMLTREHELNTQLAEAQGKLRQAEEAIGWFKQELPRKDGEIANLTDEVHTLRERVNTLLENLASQEQLNNYQSGNDLFNKHRSMRPPGGGRNV